MENKTKYNESVLFGYFWIYMRMEEGKVAKRCSRKLTAYMDHIMFS